MAWEDIWTDITNGGNQRWKSGEQETIVYDYIEKQGVISDGMKILVPLAGDSHFVPHLWSKGHAVAANEMVPLAVETLKSLCGESHVWEVEHVKLGSKKHSTEHLTIHECSVFDLDIPAGTFDLIYDKDAFGALEIADRSEYLKLMHRLLKVGGYVALLCRYREDKDRLAGPPFHIDADMVVNEFWTEERGYQLICEEHSILPSAMPNSSLQLFLLQKIKD